MHFFRNRSIILVLIFKHNYINVLLDVQICMVISDKWLPSFRHIDTNFSKRQNMITSNKLKPSTFLLVEKSFWSFVLFYTSNLWMWYVSLMKHCLTSFWKTRRNIYTHFAINKCNVTDSVCTFPDLQTEKIYTYRAFYRWYAYQLM